MHGTDLCWSLVGRGILVAMRSYWRVRGQPLYNTVPRHSRGGETRGETISSSWLECASMGFWVDCMLGRYCEKYRIPYFDIRLT